MNFRRYCKMFYVTILKWLYAKSTYKIFLYKTFDEMDEETRKLKLLTNFFSNELRPITINAPFSNSMLVVAPHQDDESIGCGGAILAQKESGKNINIIFVSDGGDEYHELGYSTRMELVLKREEEAKKVASFIGIDPPRFLRCQNIKANQRIISSALYEEIESTKANSIFTPFFVDGYDDHPLVTVALANALRKINREVTVYCYEVWSLCIGNVLLNIDDFIEKKEKMISLYESQCKATDYVNSSIGLNKYRAMRLGRECKHAECFFEVPKNEFIEIIDCINPDALGVRHVH